MKKTYPVSYRSLTKRHTGWNLNGRAVVQNFGGIQELLMFAHFLKRVLKRKESRLLKREIHTLG